MPSLHRRRRPPRSKRFAGWMLGAAAMIAGSLVSPEALAGEPTLGKTAFGTARLSWNVAPPIHLQPEGARLALFLPVEWMPAPDLGIFGRRLDPNKHWTFRHGSRLTRASLGTRPHLHINDFEHAIEFGLSVTPRAAVAIFHFDPTLRLR